MPLLHGQLGRGGPRVVPRQQQRVGAPLPAPTRLSADLPHQIPPGHSNACAACNFRQHSRLADLWPPDSHLKQQYAGLAAVPDGSPVERCAALQPAFSSTSVGALYHHTSRPRQGARSNETIQVSWSSEPCRSERGTVLSRREAAHWFALAPQNEWCWMVCQHMEVTQKGLRIRHLHAAWPAWGIEVHVPDLTFLR